MYATNEERKKKAFMVKWKNLKEEIGIWVTFMLEIKLQNYIS